MQPSPSFHFHSVQDCTLTEQFERLDSLIEQIDENWLQLQLEPGSFSRSYRREGGNEGVINPLWMFRARSLLDLSLPPKPLVLRVSNPHPFWYGKTRHEARMMEAAREAGVPVARIIHYTDEFMLMEQVPGVTLEHLIKSLSAEQKVRIYQDVMVIFAAFSPYTARIELTETAIDKLASIKVPLEVIGSFGEAEPGVPGPCLFDGPRIGPFSTYEQFIRSCGEWALYRMRSSNVLNKLECVQKVIPLLQQFLQERLHSRCHKLGLTQPNNFRFCHLDIHPGNLMVDPETLELRAVLDWEASKPTTYLDELLSLHGFSDTMGCELLFAQHYCAKLSSLLLPQSLSQPLGHSSGDCSQDCSHPQQQPQQQQEQQSDEQQQQDMQQQQERLLLEVVSDFDEVKCAVMHCVWAVFTCSTWFAAARGEREKVTNPVNLEIAVATEECEQAYEKLSRALAAGMASP